jgi:hypothetical protein
LSSFLDKTLGAGSEIAACLLQEGYGTQVLSNSHALLILNLTHFSSGFHPKHSAPPRWTLHPHSCHTKIDLVLPATGERSSAIVDQKDASDAKRVVRNALIPDSNYSLSLHENIVFFLEYRSLRMLCMAWPPKGQRNSNLRKVSSNLDPIT